jgi:hypothetical protein
MIYNNNMDNTIDLLQIKIEKAKAELPEDTQNAINAVDWRAVVLGMREKRGYSFEQLEDLQTETELVLCGLLSPENYSKELEKRLRLPKNEVSDLVKEIDSLVFAKIKENLIKIIERKKEFTKEIPPRLVEEGAGGGDSKENHLALGTPPQKGGEEQTPSILTQKLSGPVKNDVVETEHSLNNISKISNPNEIPVSEAPTATPLHYPPKEDPYRLPPE